MAGDRGVGPSGLLAANYAESASAAGHFEPGKPGSGPAADHSAGAKGVGEIGITGVAAALANAVHNATGKGLRRLPILPEDVMAS